MNEVLMRLVLQQMVFLELSGDDIINPDAAVREMDSITGELEGLSAPEKQKFVAFVRKEAQKAKSENRATEYIDFLDSVPEGFGLTD